MKDNKLISMTDRVIQLGKTTSKAHGCEMSMDLWNYANFLKQPLMLGMFLPCNEEGDILEEPKGFKQFTKDKSKLAAGMLLRCGRYQQAKDRVLFEGFEVVDYANREQVICNGQVVADDNVFRGHLSNIESLVNPDNEYDLTLTLNTIKQIEG